MDSGLAGVSEDQRLADLECYGQKVNDGLGWRVVEKDSANFSYAGHAELEARPSGGIELGSQAWIQMPRKTDNLSIRSLPPFICTDWAEVWAGL